MSDNLIKDIVINKFIHDNRIILENQLLSDDEFYRTKFIISKPQILTDDKDDEKYWVKIQEYIKSEEYIKEKYFKS